LRRSAGVLPSCRGKHMINRNLADAFITYARQVLLAALTIPAAQSTKLTAFR